MTKGLEALRPGKTGGGNIATIRAVLPYLWMHDRPDLKRRVVISVIALVLAKVATVIAPFFYKEIIDDLAPATASNLVTTVIVAPIALIVIYGITRILMVTISQFRDGIFAKVGQNAVRHLAKQTFAHLHELSLRFHLEKRTGGLSRVIDRGTKGIEVTLRFSLFNTFPTMLEMVFVCAVLWYNFSLLYAIITAITVLMYVWFTYKATEWRIELRRQMNEADNDAGSKAIDSLLNFETVKYFGNERHETDRFDVSMAEYEIAATKTLTSLAFLNSGQVIIFTTGMILSMGLAAQGVAAGDLSVGDFVMVHAFLIQLYLPLNFLGTVYRDIKQGLLDIETMFDVLSVEPEVADREEAAALEVAKGEIEFDHVDFSYDPARPILRDVSFKVPAGKTVAIVGPSGAGKSTISRILFRFYDITAGRVLIDGQDIREVSQASLRSALGMVPQDTILFNDTIRYNIHYGDPDKSNDEVIKAAKSAQIHNFIMELPEKYDAMVGERGLKLSGGEKQRIAIARTILKAPPVLILDEATSALDTYTEREIQEALKLVSKGRTTLVIAHRLSTVVDADQIIVLEKGVIVERGSHDQLLKKQGLYAGMWQRQQDLEEARERLKQTLEAEAVDNLVDKINPAKLLGKRDGDND
jgi:ATP-binding cassette, subfamily B, heavy metal transporter